MPQLAIRLRKVAEMKRDPMNARKHSPDQIDQIKASIRRFGYTSPVLEDEVIRAGNGRHEAVEQMYAEGETIFLAPGADRGGSPLPLGTIPAIDCTGWTAEERQAYALADNQLALNAEWDNERLSDQLRGLIDADFDIPIIGFDDLELNRLLGPPDGNTDPNEVLEPPAHPVSRLGDLWLLGDHRLLCGSSTDPECVARLLGGDKPVLMVTDPPYGVNYDPDWRNSAERSTKIKGRKIGATAVGKVQNDDRADWREAWDLFRGDVAYVWHAGLFAGTVQTSLEASGFTVRSQIIWKKEVHIIGRGDYHWKHEPCWYAVRDGSTGHFNRKAPDGRKQNTVWEVGHRSSETGHSTQKPLECMRRPIENNSRPGEVVYEPFAGSFTTGIACEMTRRRCFALELDPAYADVGIIRWQRFTGQAAVLDGTGQTFAEVAKARGLDVPRLDVPPDALPELSTAG